MDEGPGEVEAGRRWGVSRHQLGRPARNKAYQRKLVEEPGARFTSSQPSY